MNTRNDNKDTIIDKVYYLGMTAGVSIGLICGVFLGALNERFRENKLHVTEKCPPVHKDILSGTLKL